MLTLKVTAQELQSGQLSDAHRTEAVAAIRSDGMVVLEDVVDPAHLEMLYMRMGADLERILAREDAPFNFNAGNVQQDPPPFAPYLFRDILLNELVIAVTRALLGPGLKNSFYSGNTALTGGERQPVHPDVGQLWPDLERPTPPFGLVVNVPVVDMGPENGSTEIWPGTHLDTRYSVHDGSLRIPVAVLEQRRQIYPPVQPTVRRGSVIIRDIRLWHAGMPNHSPTARPMIAMIHWTSWYAHAEPIRFPKGTEAFFTHPTLRTHAVFVDEVTLDHTQHNQAYDFRT